MDGLSKDPLRQKYNYLKQLQTEVSLKTKTTKFTGYCHVLGASTLNTHTRRFEVSPFATITSEMRACLMYLKLLQSREGHTFCLWGMVFSVSNACKYEVSSLSKLFW